MAKKKKTISIKKVSPNSKLKSFPKVIFDKDNQFVSIQLSNGIEYKSYEKDGFIFCENKAGRVIEVQVLNSTKL